MSILCLFDSIINSINNIQGKYNSVDYSTFISIVLTALSVILTAMTLVIGIVAWCTLSKIRKDAKKAASKAVDSKLEELEKEKIIPFIKKTVFIKVDEQIEIMMKNGELKGYVYQEREFVLNPDTQREFEEKEE